MAQAQKTFRLPSSIADLPHRERIIAKRKLYATPVVWFEPVRGDYSRKQNGLPHQGKRECARRAA